MTRVLFAGLVWLCVAGLAWAQDDSAEGDEDGSEAELSEGELIEDTFQPQTLAEARGAVLRGLDKLTAETQDLTLTVGQTQQFGRVEVRLGECRAPSGNPNGDAYAWLEVSDTVTGEQVFAGWMVASSPALSAMDHPRIDIWVLRCTNS